MRLKAENVFKPSAYPEYTYVSGNYEETGISYELGLKQTTYIAISMVIADIWRKRIKCVE